MIIRGAPDKSEAKGALQCILSASEAIQPEHSSWDDAVKWVRYEMDSGEHLFCVTEAGEEDILRVREGRREETGERWAEESSLGRDDY